MPEGRNTKSIKKLFVIFESNTQTTESNAKVEKRINGKGPHSIRKHIIVCLLSLFQLPEGGANLSKLKTNFTDGQ